MIWGVKKFLYKCIHKGMKLVIRSLKWPLTEFIIGEGSIKQLPEKIKEDRIERVLVVTDRVLMELSLLNNLFQSLHDNNIEYVIYDGVYPNPTIENVEEGLEIYIENNCEAIISFGGGSSMDCGKAIAARVTNQHITVKKMQRFGKLKKDIAPLYAVPTTAGTGSETSIAAVITDSSNHKKYAFGDLKLKTRLAILDPELHIGLPKTMTATCGIDALTHAVEAYIGGCPTKLTDDAAEKAVKLIFDNIETAYNEGDNLKARGEMCLAAYYGGVSIIGLPGYVHAIAHQIGGIYSTPHGLAISIILPYILDYSRKDCEKRLARLAIITGVGTENESDEDLSYRFISKVKELNKIMNIPTYIETLKEEDIPVIAKGALKEANPFYPVPTLMNQKQCEELIYKLLP